MFYTVFGFPLCSVYCNTLLANLNARTYIRGETTTHHTDVDLFTTSTSISRAPDSPKVDKYRRESGLVSFCPGGFLSSKLSRSARHGAYPMTMVTVVIVERPGVTFAVGNRPSPTTSENTCV